MTPPHSEAEPRGWRFLAAAWAIVGVALWLRFHRIGAYELWLDEAFTFEMAATPQLGEALRRENSPPLYYLLQRAWLVFGSSEAALRSLAALFGTAFVGALIFAGRRFLSPAAGLWSGALAGLAPLHVYYSQEMRPYSLLVLLLLLAYWSLWRALGSDRLHAWAAFSACALLALATHYFAALGLVAALSLVWLRPGASDRAQGRRAVAALAAGAAPAAAWLVWSFWLNPHPQGSHAWIERVWESTPPSLAIPRSLEVLLLGGQKDLLPGFLKQFTLLEFPTPLRALGLALLAGLGAFALGPWGDGRLRIAELGRRKAWLCALGFIPLLVLWLGSFWRPYYVVARYDLVALPGLLLLLGLALAKLQGMRRAGLAAAGSAGLLLAFVMGCKLVLYYDAAGETAGPSARRTARALDGAVADGDLVVMTPGRGIPVGYYLGRLGWERRDGVCVHGASGRRFSCWNLPFDDEGIVLDLDHLDRTRFSAAELEDALRAALAGLDPAGNSVWLERRLGPPPWLAVDHMLAREARRAGFVRSAAPPPLGALRFWRHTGADSAAH